ncbi:MAG: CBS domain-containing protein [Candidatus Acidiferrales bacterium]
MPIGEICIREVIICNRSINVLEAAQLMRRYHVGDLVIVDESGGKRIPVGLITDRDIVTSVIAMQLDPATITAGDLISRDIVVVREDQGVFETIEHMRAHGVRRMPVVDQQGALVGIISVDDLTELLAEELSQLSKLISKEQAQEVERKPSNSSGVASFGQSAGR